MKPLNYLPNFITIKYLVAMNDYENVNANSFKAIVNYEQIKEKQKSLQVEIVRSPSEVKILKTEPT
jgi:phosphotransferase system IIB component